ncbi:MAG: D-alanine--D-alanine ligase [Epsilonproteobacteria bacterium]|nr:D-alanine--D-alanine ligase [Campylobacterota bacterium]OIO16785.1 MAG: D-alanine--D-alanine ligase A [Helicobacteraceae bacterium CG1_02_36_14]PIP10059.1 MAG: D-alanine--D-alanine ligase [Sulfurimonas sp. CG23_combo_of_CG06-09_8_20_14_all_36_33]PIS23655.1 MAG: D-alanine--D-alanine ligase [Sulfurimonas sp. CG08_land_8_20_14_0_20_36_33]PIU34842.1 MAG: D-alanine--D-alanine ligase [Sulfurimonas sp. CG07_land_8_20_14_0_80_36_56]PIV05110.1 MAG: D-alanine--D-alanine ligase [Sulfurimonas sp. CG03_
MRLTILFGGASFEHEISIVSAITLKEKLSGFDLTFVFCDQDHKFYLINPSKMRANTFSKGEHKKMPELHLSLGSFVQKGLFGATEHKGVVLNLIHGADGEDGTIAALLDFFSIDYIGPRVDASVFSYDKRYTKWLCDARKIKSVKYEILSAKEQKDITIPYPIIIKPARLGSSIGVSIVKEESELDYALDTAFEFDNALLVEPFLTGVKEYNLAGYMADGKMHYSIVEEPQKNEFLDFEKKYMDFSRSEQVLKADIDIKLENKLRANFEKIYKNLFEGALIRCDFFVVDGEVYLNEINPIPGSMANYLFEDFKASVTSLSNSLPHAKRVKVSYDYIHSISSAKGK